MKVGDLVGKKGTWTDERGLELKGIVVRSGKDGYSSKFVEVLSSDGEIELSLKENLEVIYYGN